MDNQSPVSAPVSVDQNQEDIDQFPQPPLEDGQEYNDPTEFESDEQENETDVNGKPLIYQPFIQLGEDEEAMCSEEVIRVYGNLADFNGMNMKTRSEPDLRKIGMRWQNINTNTVISDRDGARGGTGSIDGGGRGDADSLEDLTMEFDFPSTKSELGSEHSQIPECDIKNTDTMEKLVPCGKCTYCLGNHNPPKSNSNSSAASSISSNSIHSEEGYLHRREQIDRETVNLLRFRSESEPENLDRYRKAVEEWRKICGSGSSSVNLDDGANYGDFYELSHSTSFGILEGELSCDREDSDEYFEYRNCVPLRRCYSMGQLSLPSIFEPVPNETEDEDS